MRLLRGALRHDMERVVALSEADEDGASLAAVKRAWKAMDLHYVHYLTKDTQDRRCILQALFEELVGMFVRACVGSHAHRVGLCVLYVVYVTQVRARHTCSHAWVWIYIYICVYAYIYICIYVYICVYVYICIYAYARLCVCVCVSICTRKKEGPFTNINQ